MKLFTACVLLLLCACICRAQNDSTIITAQENNSALHDSATIQGNRTVKAYVITGARRTKDYMVKREFAFEVDKTYAIPDLLQRLELTRQQLMNTALFVSVSIRTVDIGPEEVNVLVDVKERWYLFPVPFFKIVSRNWNEWIKQYGADLNRVNYGLKLRQANLSGRNDRLNVFLVSGYTREFSFGYNAPYLDKKLQQGLGFGFSYSRNREVNYETSFDTLRLLKLPGFAFSHVSGNIGYSYRKGSKERHNVGISYSRDAIDKEVVKANPEYFGKGRDKINYLDLGYSFQYFNVDYIPYPLTGWYTDVYTSVRLGTGASFLSVGGKFLQSWKLASGLYFAFQAAGNIKLPFNQPYYNNRMMGFGDLTMRGLEYNVIDGAAGGMLRGTLRKKLLQFNLRTPFKNPAYSRIPFTFYGKIYTDAGYVYNQNPGNTRLANRYLQTGGFGIDILSIYDTAIKLEFSFNQLGGKGLFVHNSNDF